MECPVKKPCPPKCCYPDVRRSNPTCEALGTTAIIWKHQSGGGLAEDGRLNVSERPWLKSVIGNRPLMRPDDGGVDHDVFEVWIVGHRGEQPIPHPVLGAAGKP